jgi:hypothetical protein
VEGVLPKASNDQVVVGRQSEDQKSVAVTPQPFAVEVVCYL